MSTKNRKAFQLSLSAPIDWRDWRIGLLVGVVVVVMKVLSRWQPDWGMGGLDGLVATFIVLGYVIYRARREPEKLDEWGLTTPVTGAALLAGGALLLLGALTLALAGLLLPGKLSFEVDYIARMIRYIPGAFPQQFFMCSVGLVTLSKIVALQGPWRLPLTVGIIFGLAHFWTPAPLPGTNFPIQILVTAPMGALAAWYFLRFRTILPLIVCHVVHYVLLVHWVERHL